MHALLIRLYKKSLLLTTNFKAYAGNRSLHFLTMRAARRPRNANPFVMVMLFQAFRRAMDEKVFVTLALAGFQAALFFFGDDPRVPGIHEICLLPAAIIYGKEFQRLILSAFWHADDMHLYFNMTSFIYKGILLEKRYGTAYFAAMVAYLTVATHTIYVAAAYLFSDIPLFAGSMTTCAVGFSGVIFGLKTILNVRSPTMSSIYGIVVPSKYAAWIELLLIQLLVPRASFLGHLCGIVAGESGVSYCHYCFINVPQVFCTSRWSHTSANSSIS